MTKDQEIDLLNKFTGQANLAGAGYLTEALNELQPFFQSTIRSDFSGMMGTQRMIDCARHAREDQLESEKKAAQAREEKRELDREIRSLEGTKAACEQKIREISELAGRIGHLAN